MASWDTPAVAAPSAANYAAPLVDFSKINPVDDYYKGRQEVREEDKANLFRNGIPKDAGGNIDVGTITDKLARINPDYAMPLINMQIQGQMGRDAANAINGASGATTPQAPAPQRAPGSGPVQPPAAPAAAAQPTVMTILSAQGVPNDQLQAASDSLARQLGVQPNEPIDTKDPQVANVLRAAIPRLKTLGQVVQEPGAPQAGASQTVAQAAPQAPQGAAQPAASAAQPQSGNTGWTQADADAASLRATRLNGYAAAIAGVNPKAAEAAKAEAAMSEGRAKQIRDYISGEDTSTNEQKNASDPNVLKFEQTKAQQANDVDRFGKQYDAIAKVGDQADETLPQLALAKRLVNDPNFVSGSLAPGSDMMKRLSVAFGMDPSTATPDQLFDKVRAGSILNQIKGMAGTGPVRVAEMKFIDQMIAGRENTPETLRTLLDIESRLYDRAKTVRDMANNYNNGHLDAGFTKKVADYKNSNELFSPAELKDPRLIAPPVFNTPQELTAAKLSHGAPFKTADGRIKYVH